MNYPYKDKSLSPEARAVDLLSRMSLNEKMSQISGAMPVPMPGFTERLKSMFPHGIGAMSCLTFGMMCTTQEAAKQQREFQDLAMSLSEHRIPAMFHIEGITGAMVQEAESFPSPIGRGAGWNPSIEIEIGRITGRKADALGVSQVFAPVLDLTRDARFGRFAESYGEDASLLSAMGSAYISGVQENKSNVRVESVAKHFLGYHASPNGIHASSVNIPERELREVYAKPFQAAITGAGLRGIMPAYCGVNGESLSRSETYLTKLLRDEMGFEGIVVADYSAISEIHSRHMAAGSFTDAGYKSLRAGMDVELPNKHTMNDELRDMFENGTADISILDRAVLRVLTTKFRMGLFENPYAMAGEELERTFRHACEKDINRRSAKESLVLLKNNGILPLSKKQLNGKKIAVIGCHADTIRILFGGYTYLSFAESQHSAGSTMEGIDAALSKTEFDTYPGTVIQRDNPAAEVWARKQKPEVKSLLDELSTIFADSVLVYKPGYDYAGRDTSMHNAALEAARDADLVILTLGGKYGTSTFSSTGEGIDSTNINLPLCQEIFIEKLAALGKPAIGVHFDGRPISSDAADAHLDAILEAWTPGEFGPEAIAAVLTGEYNPSGKLPVTIAYSSGQEPIYYNHHNGSSYHQNTGSPFKRYVDFPHEPRYFFGYGLSYTTFEYSGLKIENREISGSSDINLTVTVKNTGSVSGDEVVQVYIKDLGAELLRPNMELVGFYRVNLNPGESKILKFVISAGQLSYIGLENKWLVEAGDIEIMVGSASNDIRLTDKITVLRDIYFDAKTRGFFAKAEELAK